jgi:FkbM family methyltransferase
VVVPRGLRRFSDPILERVPIPILGGVNRGRWWNLVSAGSGYATGRRAAAQMRFIDQVVQPGDVVWDVGAHHGYVTLAAARRAGTNGRIYAFEPGTRNRRILQRHLAWNAATTVTALPYALGAAPGPARFGGAGTSKTQALGAGNDIVAIRTVESLIASGECAPPDFMKLDVEDAEADVLAGGRNALPHTAALLIGIHSRTSDERCTAWLRDRGFTCFASPRLRAARAGTWDGDPDLFAVGAALHPERRTSLLHLLDRYSFQADGEH